MTTDEIKLIYAQVARWALPFFILLIIFGAFNCHRQNSDNLDLNAKLNASLQRTQQLENKTGDLVAQNQVLFTMRQSDLKTFTDSVFNLREKDDRLTKAVLAYTKIVQEAKFGNKSASFDDRPTINEKGDTVFLPQPTDPNLVRVPRPFTYSDSTIVFAGKVRKNDVLIDSLQIPNTLSLRTIETKKGLFGRQTTVQAINSNPAFKNTGLAQIQVKHKPTAWSRWIKPSLFAAAGIFVGSQIK